MRMATCSSSRAAISRASSTGRTTGRSPCSRSRTDRKVSRCAGRIRRSITARPPRWISISAPAASHSLPPNLAVVGGKQGNIYLLDRRNLPGKLDRRPACSTDSATDALAARTRSSTSSRQARPAQCIRSLLRHVRRDGSGARPLGACDVPRCAGRDSSHRDRQHQEGCSVDDQRCSVACTTEGDATGGRAAWLAVEQLEKTLALENPGSPIVTSNGSRDPVVWVLDPNARRSALLVGDEAPQPVLYAFDAMTLRLLWRSAPGQLHASGKYNEPVIARGTVFVGTDRVQAFGLHE